ncbi:MAG: hypothetical protein NZ480_02340 [Bdellovibrionaceae bacterium]|nr:hypothetical protein [Pseudobdellovibrionaceae bacterium]MDW8189546.1 hypothetical protein [Pseudobdellovibrionaceae bacterium]
MGQWFLRVIVLICLLGCQSETVLIFFIEQATDHELSCSHSPMGQAPSGIQLLCQNQAIELEILVSSQQLFGALSNWLNPSIMFAPLLQQQDWYLQMITANPLITLSTNLHLGFHYFNDPLPQIHQDDWYWRSEAIRDFFLPASKPKNYIITILSDLAHPNAQRNSIARDIAWQAVDTFLYEIISKFISPDESQSKVHLFIISMIKNQTLQKAIIKSNILQSLMEQHIIDPKKENPVYLSDISWHFHHRILTKTIRSSRSLQLPWLREISRLKNADGMSSGFPNRENMTNHKLQLKNWITMTRQNKNIRLLKTIRAAEDALKINQNMDNPLRLQGDHLLLLHEILQIGD